MKGVTSDRKSVKPGKIICMGKNYSAHIEEMRASGTKNMVVFMKSSKSISKKLISFDDEQIHF